MKKYTRFLSCLLVVACLVSSFCIPTFAATGDFSDISPFANPERQKSQTFNYVIYDDYGNHLVTCKSEIVGVWSQVEHSAYMTNATCTFSGPEKTRWQYEVEIVGSETVIYLYRNGYVAHLLGFEIFQNGNISAYAYNVYNDTFYVVEH